MRRGRHRKVEPARRAPRSSARPTLLVRQADIRTTIISPGAVQSELPLGISDPETAAGTQAFYRQMAIPADAVARAIAFAIEQPRQVDINEILLRPTARVL